MMMRSQYSNCPPYRLCVATAIFIVAQFACPYSAYAQGADVATRMANVENGLLAPVLIKGAPVVTNTIAERMAQTHVPGISIAVMYHGKIDWAKGYGVLKVGGPPVTPETLFQAGSISKSLAAAAALHLVDQGKLSLDSDINGSLKRWKLPSDGRIKSTPVTLRELLNHTAGIGVHGFPGYERGVPVPSLLQILDGKPPANTSAIRIETPAGEKWNYSGGGYTIVQQMVIDASEQEFTQLLADTVLKPSGMTSSTFSQPLSVDMTSNAATPYDAIGNPIAGGAHIYPELAAAGLWTTPTDILKFAREIQASQAGNSNNILSQATTEAMLAPGLGSWGLGVQIGGDTQDRYFSHGGDNVGYHALFVMYEKSGDGAAIMTSGDSGRMVISQVMRSIAKEYNWPDFHPIVRSEVSINRGTLALYAGSYSSDTNAIIDLKLENGGLTLYLRPDSPMPLYPESSKKYFATAANLEVEFATNSIGRPEYLLLHQGKLTTKAFLVAASK